MTLKDAFENLKKIEFPEFSEDDQLADWMADLAEMDAYVAGIAIAVLGGHNEKQNNLKKNLVELRNRLEDITKLPDEDKPIYNACIEYLNAIERVANFING